MQHSRLRVEGNSLVLPLMVVGICRRGARDALTEWAVALADWMQHTFWTTDGAHDEATFAVSDEKLFIFEEKYKPLSGLQAFNWRFQKMHELSNIGKILECRP
jgi:hypothetical protein